MGRGWADIHIGKGVFVRFGFDVQESRKFDCKLKTKQQRTPYEVYYIRSSLASDGFLPFVGREGELYIYTGVGLSGVARFDLQGNARAFRTWNE